jgi:hypothetical protein
MSRTMTTQEYNEIIENIEKKEKELKSKQDIYDFFHQIGYCDKNGNVIPPYANTSEQGKE